MAIGQALLIRPPKAKASAQQQQAQEIQQTNKLAVLQGQPLKFEQSLELVQTLLGASVGCLSFLRYDILIPIRFIPYPNASEPSVRSSINLNLRLSPSRGLLPEECFVEKRYGGKSSAAISYRSFTSDLEDEAFKKTQSSSGTRVKRLRRGYSGEADQLLDWLEIGIFDALKMGYLKAVQLAIYVDKEHPDIIVESYTFSFSYSDKNDGTSTIDLQVTDINGHGVMVEDANKNLQLMMRRLIVITQNLPPLPDQRWLTIRLHYLDHTPSNYDPPSFIRVSEKSPVLKFHENDTKEVEKLDVGGLNAGFHAVSLKISSMNNTNSQERPKRRRGSRLVDAGLDIEAPQFAKDTSRRSERVCTNYTNELPPGPVASEYSRPKDSLVPVDTSPMLYNQTIGEIKPVVRRIREGTRRDIQEKMFLRGMLRQETRENDVVATQPLSLTFSGTISSGNQPIPSIPESPLAPIQVLDTSRPLIITPERFNLDQQLTHTQASTSPLESSRLTNNIESVGKNMARLKLSKAKATELKKSGKKTDKGAFERKKKPDEDHVNCECGHEKFEEDMICCDNCDEWQHTDCYGFDSAKDTRIPDYHVCYSCLLGKNEGKLLEEMRDMALFRRALKTIWNQGNFPSSNKAFSNKLGCDLPTALQITRRLENEGFIINDAAKSKLHKKKVYKVVKTDDTKQLMEAEYFDPLKKISHHFENQTFPNIIRESLLGNATLLAGPLLKTFSETRMDTVVKESQFEEVGNTTKDAIVIYQPKTYAHMADLDTASTADEEDDIPVQSTAWDNFGRRKPTMDRLRHPNTPNTTSLGYKHPAKKQELLLEISESPEPMEIDSIGQLQAIGSLRTHIATRGLAQPRMNIGGVIQDIFVGEEVGDRRF